MTRHSRRIPLANLRFTAFFALLLLPLAGCGDSGTAPDESEVEAVAGTYVLSTLRFDPQGVLPDQDVLEALGTNEVQLILTINRAAQVFYRDPISNLVVTVQGSFQMTGDGVRIQWDQDAPYPQLLLSRSMGYTFDEAAGTLRFDGDAPDGVSRARLVALVPEFQGEQLLDPTPGRLRVTFTQTN